MGIKWRHGGRREVNHIADRPGTKKGTGPKKLIFDFSKGILHRVMIKFEVDPVLGYKSVTGQHNVAPRTRVLRQFNPATSVIRLITLPSHLISPVGFTHTFLFRDRPHAPISFTSPPNLATLA